FRRAQDHSLGGQLPVITASVGALVEQDPAQAEVQDFDRRVQRVVRSAGGADRHQHQVGRLEVAVNQPMKVNVLQALERLVNQPDSFRTGQLAAALEDVLQ